jgi:tetratricopeptide (TPR) repeat protein
MMRPAGDTGVIGAAGLEARVGSTVQDLTEQAEAAQRSGDLHRCHALAVEGLASRSNDARLLALAGRASLELGLDDAADLLRRLVGQHPEDGDAWRDLGLALVDAGDLTGAERALREALARDPDDTSARVNLAHVAYTLGRVGDATELLAAAARETHDPAVTRNLLEMYRAAGQRRAALETAQLLVERAPDDPLALLDLAELHLQFGEHDDALAAYRRLRDADAEPGHASFALHGMIEVELRSERWRRALDLAIAATEVDRHQLTTDLLAFVTARLFGPGHRPSPEWADLQHELAQQRAEHRRRHVEALVS